MQQNQCLRSSANGHIATLQWHYFLDFLFFSLVAFTLLRSFALLLSPPFQWFIYIFFCVAFASFASRKNGIFANTWHNIVFRVHSCTDRWRRRRRRRQRHRPKCACASNTKWREREMYFIYFAVYSIRFSEHTNALFSDRNEDIQRLTQARKKILNKINGTCVFAYSASVRWCALQRTSVAASFDSITFTSLVRFATFDFILISFFFLHKMSSPLSPLPAAFQYLVVFVKCVHHFCIQF